MKGIVFTLDALFALTITLVSISVLLFFTYYAQTPYTLRYSNVQTLLTDFASTSVGSVRNSSPIAASLVQQYLGANETSPEFLGGPQGNSSNQVGPLYPILDFVYKPGNTITTSVVADYGNIYFAANNILYAVNASANRTVWTRNTISNVVTTPVLYSGMLLYGTSTDLDAVSAMTGGLIWTVNSVVNPSYAQPTTALTAYDNQVIFASGTTLYAYYANNGTSAWSTYTTNFPMSIIELEGSLEVGSVPSTGFPIVDIRSVVQASGSANVLVYTAPNPTAGITDLAGSGTNVYFGGGITSAPFTANAIHVDGTTAPGFPIVLNQPQPTGVAAYKSYVVYQSRSYDTAFSPTATSYWKTTMPSSFGTITSSSSLVNATPVISGTMVYTLWPNGLAAQNLTTGSMLWFAFMPATNTIMPFMTLAYGRLYVVVNNAVRAYGSCYSPLHATLLSAAATMYWNSQPGCASALLNSVYPLANYSLFVGNAIPNSLMVASFNGMQGYVSAQNTGALDSSSYVSASFWVNVSALPASTIRLVNYGDNGNCNAPTPYCGWFFSLTPTGNVLFNVMDGSAAINAISPAITTKKWYMVTGVYNGTYLNLYINVNGPYTTNYIGTIIPPTSNIYLTIGGGMPCCNNAYLTGNVANLQVYGNPFNPQQVAQLYRQGIGSAPIKSYALAAWYPLDGDANDYALFNSGFVTGSVSFVTISYSSPAYSNAYEISKTSTLLPLFNYTTGSSNTVPVGVLTWS